MNRRSFLRTLGLGSAALAITGCVIPEKREWDRRPWEPKWDDALVQRHGAFKYVEIWEKLPSGKWQRIIVSKGGVLFANVHDRLPFVGVGTKGLTRIERAHYANSSRAVVPA